MKASGAQIGERTLRLEQQLATLRRELQARPTLPPLVPHTVPYRLAEVSDDTNQGENTIPVRFLDGSFTEIPGNNSVNWIGRQASTSAVALSISGDTPSKGTKLLVFPWQDRWWFYFTHGGTPPEITAAQSNAFWSPEWYWYTGPNAGTVRQTGDRIDCVPSNDQREVELKFLEQSGPNIGLEIDATTKALKITRSGTYSFTIAGEVRPIADQTIAAAPTNEWFPSYWSVTLATNEQLESNATPPSDPTEKWRRGIRYDNSWATNHVQKTLYAKGYKQNYSHPEWTTYGVDVYDFDTYIFSATQTEYLNVPASDFITLEMKFTVSNVAEGGWGYDNNIGFELRRPHLLITKWD